MSGVSTFHPFSCGQPSLIRMIIMIIIIIFIVIIVTTMIISKKLKLSFSLVVVTFTSFLVKQRLKFEVFIFYLAKY